MDEQLAVGCARPLAVEGELDHAVIFSNSSGQCTNALRTGVGAAWPIADPTLSDKDRNAQSLAEWLARPDSSHFTYAEPARAR